MLGYMNGWLREVIAGGFGVPGENDNGRRVVDLCGKRGLSVSNTDFILGWLEHKIVKNMLDLVLVKKAMLHCAPCEDSERNGKRSLRSSSYTI